MTTLRLLVGLRVRLFVAELRRSPATVVGVVIGVVLFGVALVSGRALFFALVRFDPATADVVVLLAFAAIGMFQVLAAFRWTARRMYFDSDLELLLAAPVSHAALFVSKLVEVAATSWVSILLLVAIGTTYGTARALPFAIALAVIAALALSLFATLPGVVFTMLVARVFSAARVRALLALLPMLFAFVVVAVSPIGDVIGRRLGPQPDPDRIRGLVTGARNALAWVPTSWPAGIVLGPANSNWTEVGRSVVLVVAATAVLLAVGYAVFRSTFYVTWGRLGEAPRRSRSGLLDRLAPPLPTHIRAIVLKDWRTAVRDTRVLAGMFFPIGFLAFIAISSVNDPDQSPLSLFFITTFIIGSVGSQLLHHERRNIALLRDAPLRGRDVIAAKLVAALVPLGLVLAVLVIVTGALAHRSVAEIAGIVMVALWVAGGAMIANIAAAALWTDFSVERARLGLLATVVSSASAFLFAGASVGAAAWLVARVRGVSGFWSNPGVGLGAAVLLGAGVFLVRQLAALGARRLETMDCP